jgi:uncharacterized repeat protein (TIGR01451 family)
VIGGFGAPQGNRIAFNQQNGVRIVSGANNAILANRVFQNGQLGIDLGPAGVTPNDAGDADSGANDLQNFPVLSSAPNGVQGTLSSTPNTLFRIDFYANTACDASGNGEGATFLQSMNVGTDASGLAPIPAITVASGTFVTATATSPTLSTSEFSACFQSAASNVRTWISDTSGFWEDATNWSEGIVPRNGDSVTINNTGNSFIVQVQSAVVALNTLHSDQSIAITGGAITVAGASDFAAGLLLSGGSVGGSGDITLGAGSFWSGGTIAGPGNLIVGPTGGLSMNSPGQTLTLGRSLSVDGSFSSTQTSLSLTNGAQIAVKPSGTFAVSGTASITNNSGTATTLTNQGAFEHFTPSGDITLTGVSFVTSGQVAFVYGSAADRIVSDAPGTLGGSLLISLAGPFTPTTGVPFEVLRFSNRTGTFAFINGGTQTYTPTYTATSVQLTAQPQASADLAIAVDDAPDPVVQGGTLTYTLTVTNNGPDPASDVFAQDQQLPQPSTFISAVPSQGSCVGTSTVTCSLGALASGASATVVITLTPQFIGTAVNTVVVTSAVSDPNLANNADSEATTSTAAPATFVVTNTNDTGAGSLRQAMLDANARTGTLDTITFAIPGAGVHTITPASFLPTITDPVVIDGSTQPGAANAPLIEIAGTNAGPSSNGFFITAANTTIRGLAINRFGTGGTAGASGGAGIVIQGPGGAGAVIEGNFIGMDTGGTLFRPNRSDGVFVDNSPNNRIGGTSGASGNVISGNGRNGITLSGASTTGTVIVGNNIGIDINLNGGSFQQTGIVVSGASGNLIGSTTGVGNFIAFNTGNGIDVLSGTSNALLRNRIFSNGALGINLGPAGPTANDPNDVDVGANNLQNFPQLS